MNFVEAISKKKYYSSINELLKDNKRLSIWNENKSSLSQLTNELLYLYELNDVSLINEIIQKNVYKIDTVSIMYELNKSDFENFIDSHIIEDFDFDIYCLVEDNIYHYNGKLWMLENIKINKLSIMKFLNE